MQSDFYRSPTPAEPYKKSDADFSQRSARRSMPRPRFGTRGIVPLAIFSAGILVLLVCLVGVRVSGWDMYFTATESITAFDDDVGEDDDWDYSDYFSEFGDEVEEETEPSITAGPLDENFRLELNEPGETLSAGEIYDQVLPSIVYIETADDTARYSGTGVILTEDGYLMTNSHLISGCSSAWTTLSSGERYESTLVGYDNETDLAVLKISGTGLPAAEFGDSELVQVGDSVLAIGNPMGSGLYGTMTDGIVSAVDRRISVNGYSMKLIQTSAALNSGNSGGALLNSSGQVIGITNVKMESSVETLEGLGFAIPSSVVKEVGESLISSGSIIRPSIGITCYELTESESELLGIDGGIAVEAVTAGSPAQEAGVRTGDIILEANGQQTTTLDQLTSARNRAGVGGVLELTILRGDQTLTLTIVLGES
ncbi:MAG: trypsin-like peptidase domain-containing protein [Oscillospiraceae bacterium]|nr:trypsin-like peptidase domain-containing protein [Oscillospiraceae bacterium]